MKKQYLMPATQEQSMTMCQLMVGSYIPGMNINGDPISGEEGNISFGN